MSVRTVVALASVLGLGRGALDAQAAGPAVPARVNSSLAVDWTLLDGVQTFAEVGGAGGYRFLTTTRYTVTRAASGTPTVERVVTTLLRRPRTASDGRGPALVDVAEDVLRTRFTATAENDMESSYDRRPLVAGVDPSSWHLAIHGVVFTYVETGKAAVTGVAPPGILPGEFTGAPVVAHAGALPDALSYWVFDRATRRPMLVGFANTHRAIRNVPVAAPGSGGCSPTAPTHLQILPVVEGYLKIGGTGSRVWYLTTAPHVNITIVTNCITLIRRAP